MQYYIISLKNKQGVLRSFWKPEAKGYTYNINLAGKFSGGFVKQRGLKILNKSNRKILLEEDHVALSDTFLPLIGKRSEVYIK